MNIDLISIPCLNKSTNKWVIKVLFNDHILETKVHTEVHFDHAHLAVAWYLDVVDNNQGIEAMRNEDDLIRRMGLGTPAKR